jgi:hypothetical protein
MVAASITATSARVAAKAGRTSATNAPRVGAFCAPKMGKIPSMSKESTFSASVAARVSSVKVRYSQDNWSASPDGKLPRSYLRLMTTYNETTIRDR